MIHIDKGGDVIGSFDPRKGTAWRWTAKDSSTSGTPTMG